MSAPGWVKLSRSLLDWEWMGDPNVVTVYLQVLLRANYEAKRWQGIDERALLVTLGKTALATAVMAVVMLAITPAVESLTVFDNRRLVLLLHGGLLARVGGVVYLLATLILRMEEVYQLPGLILRRRRSEAVAVGD